MGTLKSLIPALVIAFTIPVVPTPSNAQVACTPTSNVACDLTLDIIFEPGNVEFTVPSQTVTIPANALIQGASISIDVPIENTGSFNITNGQFTIAGLPSYVTIPAPPAFNIPSGGTTTVTLLATIGEVPTTATATTATVAVSAEGDLTAAPASFSY